MYNRYLQNDLGVYTPVPVPPREPPQHPPESPPHRPQETLSPRPQDEEGNFLSRMLKKFHLDDLDGGDILLVLLILFLLQEKADDELLIALGLLLIL